MIIDATDLIVGRMSTFVAKHALLGEPVDIINVEKAVISGSRQQIIAKYKQKWGRSTIRMGPYIHRMPDRFVRRIIRGMLPHKQEKGEIAFKKIMCYIGHPKSFEGKKIETIKDANVVTREITHFMRISDVCQELGAKTHE